MFKKYFFFLDENEKEKKDDLSIGFHITVFIFLLLKTSSLLSKLIEPVSNLFFLDLLMLFKKSSLKNKPFLLFKISCASS